MSFTTPFLKPSLPPASSYLPLLEQMDASGIFSNFGPINRQFEQQLLDQLFGGTGALTTVGNCTLGLMLAISALKRPSGRYAIMPSFTFAATPLAAQWCGLEPYFVDVDPDSWSTTPAAVAAAVEKLGDQAAIAVPYATFGQAIDLTRFHNLHQNTIPVVIDAAPGLGCTTANGSPFAVDFPGAVVFSCHATKPFGIGEGGVIYSGDKDLIGHARRASNFGFNSERMSNCTGMNAKLPEVLAAIGIATLAGYREKLERLSELNRHYLRALNEYQLIDRGCVLQQDQGHAPKQFFPLLLPENIDADATIASMALLGVEVKAYFRPPCHRQPQFNECKFDTLDVTNKIARRVVCLPLWDRMTSATITQVVQSLAKCIL